MRFSFVKLALLASLAAFGHAQDNECNNKDAPFAPSTKVGLQGNSEVAGSYECLTRWRTGDTIIGIEAWSGNWAIEGIRFKFANGEWSNWYGVSPDNMRPQQRRKAEWEAGEAVQISVRRNWGQKEERTAIALIDVHKGDSLLMEVYAAKKHATDERTPEIDQGAGIVLGVELRATNWLWSIEFKMLKSKIVDTTLTDMKIAEDLKDWTEKQKGIENLSLSSVYFRNDNAPGKSNMTYKFANTVTKKSSKTITNENRHTFGLGVEVKNKLEIGVPSVGSASTEVTYKANYEFSQMSSNAMTEAYDQALTWEMASGAAASMLAPGRAAHCSAWVLSGKFESEYKGTIQAELANGGTFNYTTKGKVSSVSYMDAQAECEEMDVKDIPGGANSQPGTPINSRNKRAVVFLA